MALHIGVGKILEEHVIEGSRVEYKAGFNPDAILRTICAFANDYYELGGGYIIIGAVQNDDGTLDLTRSGLEPNAIDSIQKRLVEHTKKINQAYAPQISVERHKGLFFIMLWCFAGDVRPYTVPEKVTQKNAQRHIYIRDGSVTRQASAKEEKDLYERGELVPFDDRINPQATENDIDFSLIREFLELANSSLKDQIATLPKKDILHKLHLTRGPKEFQQIRNVGVLFFNRYPQDFDSLRYAYIRTLVFKDNKPEADGAREHFSRGPLHHQLRDAIQYLQSTVLDTVTLESQDRIESRIVSNYPLKAIEEGLANAIYHRKYNYGDPVEVKVFADRIEIHSVPGPLPPITHSELQNLDWNQTHLQPRLYRNRRIGELLRLLRLTEGFASGVTKIFNAMRENGSPMPKFETDEERSYFLVTLYKHLEA